MAGQGRFALEYYNPKTIMWALQDEDIAKEIRQDYKELRKLANRRLERFKGTEWEDSKQYKRNAGRYKKLSEIKSDRELAYLLTDLQRFTSSDTSTVRGLARHRNATIETLREHGYDFINRNNIRAFGDYMEQLRAKGIARLYDSARLADVFETAEKKRVSPDEVLQKFVEYEAQQAREPDKKTNARKLDSGALWDAIMK